MPRLQVQTGDVTRPLSPWRDFRVAAERPLPRIALSFDDREVHLPASEWPALLEQVKTRSLSYWKHSRIAPPMGQADMQGLLSVVSNTPSYQLFLAGFDLAEAVGLVSELPERVILWRTIGLTERLPSVIGPGGLFIVPETLLGDNPDRTMLEELVRNNKLCRLRLEAGDLVEKYYVPYATPIGFTTPVSQQAQRFWEQLRDYLYAFR